jgi:hypothetical protein
MSAGRVRGDGLAASAPQLLHPISCEGLSLGDYLQARQAGDPDQVRKTWQERCAQVEYEITFL